MRFASAKAEGESESNQNTWISRFAPTPTGNLHFGSLVSALAVALDSHAHGGHWLLRFDDSDRFRVKEQARISIIQDLIAFGFHSPKPPRTQSARNEAYFKAAMELVSRGMAYACDCSRQDIASTAIRRNNDGGLIYPGTCRNLAKEPTPDRAIRVRVPDKNIRVTDRWCGPIAQNLTESVGDFVIWRRDSVPSYHLATVLDDAAMGVSAIVRGQDLIDSTPRQVYLQQLLGVATPSYAHHPLVTLRGRKIGKSTGARRLCPLSASRALSRALRFLGQAPPINLGAESTEEVWTWAYQHWNERNVKSRIGPSAT